uniref:Dynein regulatory complex subunit 3 n=1 Tax=Labrus bergylta TaxID=56723 RepID=A0A3Q3GP08_9LABR
QWKHKSSKIELIITYSYELTFRSLDLRGEKLNYKKTNLSYNKLEKIEGLESLRKLEVLTLSNNRISVIENMDTLEKLTLFCIGNNLIGQLDNVTFSCLKILNLCGNPASKEDDYKLFIAAYFPNLTFLDFKLLDGGTSARWRWICFCAFLRTPSIPDLFS